MTTTRCPATQEGKIMLFILSLSQFFGGNCLFYISQPEYPYNTVECEHISGVE